ncbi:MAG: DUF302 domain-containing protein [Bacteroidales bacterium]|nr:DUF302 domain-containing protein [Bacteroidales bacterium]
MLGACNPENAYQAIQAEANIGILLPCNVLLQEKQPGEVEVSVVDPVAVMDIVNNDALQIRKNNPEPPEYGATKSLIFYPVPFSRKKKTGITCKIHVIIRPL